jgi:Sulfotransferase domain
VTSTLRVVGAGLARTGTTSLKLALERLLGGPCYHMLDVFAHPEHIPVWHQAVRGLSPDWRALLDGCRAAVDLPASAFWAELAAVNPDALIVLSVRDSPQEWWQSTAQTIVRAANAPVEPGTTMASYTAMAKDMFRVRLGVADMSSPAAMMAAYQRHNDDVRAGAPPGRLLEWRAADGWAPLAAALGVPAPREPFPRVNTSSQFRVPDFDSPPGR